MPDDSATIRAELGHDAAWGISEQLLAITCELLDRNFQQLVAMTPVDKKNEASKRRALKRKPLQIPRPGVEAGDRKWRERKGTTLGQLVGMMGGKTEV